MFRNQGNFSVVGILDNITGLNLGSSFLGSALGGNSVMGLASMVTGNDAGNPTDSLATAVEFSAEKGLATGIGEPLRIGGNTAPAFQKLFPAIGRPAQALLRSSTLTKALSAGTDALEVKGAIDVGLTAALAAACN
jgi:hypothetical protein